MNIKSDYVISTINNRIEGGVGLLHFYWLQLLTDRSEFSENIDAVQDKFIIVPLILRNDAFTNPNSFHNDLIALLELNKESFKDLTGLVHKEKPLAVIVLSKTELDLPQISSPATLPHWFPVHANETVSVMMEDLTNTTEAPLNMAEARVPEMCELLYQLEKYLIRRLVATNESNHNSGNAFFELIRESDDEKYPAFLSTAQLFNSKIANPTGYRPSAKDGKSLLSRLMRLQSKSSPDQLAKNAKAFSTALNITDDMISVFSTAIFTILMRSTNPDNSRSVAFMKNLLMCIFTSSQYTTAAAHSDSYPMLPVKLIRSVSYDMRTNLGFYFQFFLELEE
jgi:hypothetical protein